MSNVQGRMDRFRRLLKKIDCRCALVTNFCNVTYLTGFTGDDSYLLVTPVNVIMLTDGRYTTQLQDQCSDLSVESRKSGVAMIELIQRVAKKVRPDALAIESESMTVDLHRSLQESLSKVQTVPTSGLVEQLRMIKDKEEIKAIRQAIDLAQRAYKVVVASLRGEQTEKQIANDLEYQIRLFGGEGCSFPPIVATGPRAALPHAQPTEHRIEEHDFVLIDWGACGRLYRSDLTRVLVTGRISPKLKRVYEVVLKAQLQAIRTIKPGVAMSAVDAKARKVIANAGFGRHFNHGLGHGIGLEIHEAPRLSATVDKPLQVGMVVTVEPGVYVPGWGGVRIEDDVLVTHHGHEVLTSVPKQLQACVVG